MKTGPKVAIPKDRVNYCISRETRTGLEKLSDKTGVPMSRLVEAGLLYVLDNFDKIPKEQLI